MNKSYPSYKYSIDDVHNEIARFVPLDNPDSYPFDNFHAHEYNEILVFRVGGGQHNINFKNYPIQNNSIHLLASHDLHWIERSMSSSGFAIMYKDQFLQKLQIVNPCFDYYSRFSHSTVIKLNEDQAQDFEFIFREMLLNQDQPKYMLLLIGAFISKIAYLQPFETLSKKIYDPIVPELVKLIDQHFKTQKTINFYAAELNLTNRTLQNRFKKASATSLTKLLQDRILKEAKKLLCGGSMNVSDISFELGFKDPAHFSHWFKKYAHCLPLEYKYEND